MTGQGRAGGYLLEVRIVRSDCSLAHLSAVYTLIQTARLNDVDPQAWLADVLARIADHPASRLDELLPWYRKASIVFAQAA